jgi:hypothetical protein
MHGQNQGAATQRGQGPVKPQMSRLEMDHIWIKFPDLLHQASHHLDLLKWMSQSRLVERPQPHGPAQEAQIRFRFTFRKEEANVRMLRDPTRQADTILSEVEGYEGNFQWTRPS